jgi:AraC-like DNA-binding protein
VVRAELPRPESGAVYGGEFDELEPSSLPGVRTFGGAKGHLDQTGPKQIEIDVSAAEGVLRRISLMGVFALHPGPTRKGSDGLLVQGFERSREKFRQPIGREFLYGDASDPTPISRVNGDGSSIETVGLAEGCRVDLVTLDVPPGCRLETLSLTHVGGQATFVIFDIFFEFEQPASCPFHSGSGGVALAELPSIVRVADRVKFAHALEQLDGSVDRALDFDEARGQCLTFLAIVSAATLETGGPRSNVRILLEAARAFDGVDENEALKRTVRAFLHQLAHPLFTDGDRPYDFLIDRALALVDRNYTKNLTDTVVAEYVGLSTSHFRFLFRQATGQPFHRYLVNVRLEKAKTLLQEGDLPVSQVASMVGFTGISHFSRAFSHRFRVSPRSARRTVGHAT